MSELVADAPRRRPLRHRPGPWTVLVFGSTVVLLAAALLLAVLWSTSNNTSSTSFTAQLPSTLLRVEIQVAEGNVEIVGGASREVLVDRVDSSAFGHWPTEKRFVADGVFRIESSCPDLVIGACAADYRITLPEKTPLAIVAEHGDIRLNAIRGPALVSSRDGSITVDAFCGSVLDANASGGDVDVVATCPTTRLTLRTGSGDIRARVPSGEYSIDAGSLDGDVTVDGIVDNPAARARIQALSNDGDVAVEAG
jgi:Putative adhesin